MAMEQDVHDMVVMWRAIKMLAPFLLMVIGGMSSMALYYLRSMAGSMKAVGESLVRMETQIAHHDDRLDKLEAHCPVLRRNPFIPGDDK